MARCPYCGNQHPQGSVNHGAAPLYNCIADLAAEVRRLTLEVKTLRDDVGTRLSPEEDAAILRSLGDQP